ncbi:L-piperidine-6-carboxylate dehydrogenase [Cupriavidus pinatubonensis]|uniref:aldehyde dehydrogenase (NAD(+)) n=1 Tax=Cupriavidus pinatubonensis TaxID=248026 RepID=A0ABM8XX66_9BURK|nr:aldehyde dehydrogenase family protein [Cupriavidus pinatubonensis]CAG9184992.1 3,6-anhydro-alpha-L-galactose dehydrogenase [Cupriavidus pinatubonensis]
MDFDAKEILARNGIEHLAAQKGPLQVRTPIDGRVLANLDVATAQHTEMAIQNSVKAFKEWRTVPAPRRGELIRLLGEELRASKAALGELVSLETGKILQEGLGEVQEMIDICDFAVGLSRQLYGLTIASERPNHRMMETWHPMGPCLVVTAFNFPVAVWAWNAALALVCGNSVIWKPSEKTPLSAAAVQQIFERTCARFGTAPAALSQLVQGERERGEQLVRDSRVPLISATGSTRMGREIAKVASERFARTILELGGNNAGIVCPSADLSLVVRAVAFAAMGTAGQRCTTLRRLIVHSSVYDKVVSEVKKVYEQVRIGSPLDSASMIGPLIDKGAYSSMVKALSAAKEDGGRVFGGERVYAELPDAYYVKPAIVEMKKQTDIVCHETFAPILYVLKYDTVEEAIALNNDVPQGLSSSLFTTDMREMELFLSAAGSDCGIANVNIGPSGAEIGGAFGGEKETGGGRESGSDSWKAYMRRATNTINFGKDLPLAQGIEFGV